MSPERWERIQDVLASALERAPAGRAAFLTAACGGDADMLAEVRSLVKAHDQAGNFLNDRPMAAPPPESYDPGDGEQIGRLIGDILYPTAAVEPPPAPQLLSAGAGHTISRYEIMEKLGGGGMGVVYKARDTRLNRIVALKFLPPHLSADEEAKTRFLHEARAASALDHVNICTIHEIGETDEGQLFIAMACYAGETLKKKVERGALPVEEAVDYAFQIAEGLAIAHDRGIIHRDIKPANIMVVSTPTGRPSSGLVKLLDFGLAKATDVSLTKASILMGTLAYMSPEQAHGDEVDQRTDIWSMGVVLYEMLAGSRPFRGTYEQAVIYSILNEEPPPVRGQRSDVPTVLEHIISKTLAKSPLDRYATATEFIQDLREARASDPVSIARPTSGAVEDDGNTDQDRLLPAGERVQATVIVSTLSGYLDLVEQLVPDDLERAMYRIRARAVEIVEHHGGIVNQCEADEIVLLFGIPAPQEDDCARAVRAVLDLHAWIHEFSTEADLGHEVGLQSGVDTGLLVAKRLDRSHQPYRIAGRTAQRASALALHAAPGEILVSPESRRLLAPFFELELRDPVRLITRDAPVAAARIVGESGIQSRLDAAIRAGLTPFTGREQELKTLGRCLEQVLRGEGQFVTLVGEAGLGKSRLLHEFQRRLDGERVAVLQGRCLTDGGVSPYPAFIDVLRHHLLDGGRRDNPVDRVVDRVRQIDAELEKFIPLYLHLLSLQSAAYPVPEHLEGEHHKIVMREAISALLTLSARQSPLVLMLEDWHWSDDASRDVLNQVIELIPAYPLLVVVTYRPEYVNEWGHPGNQTSIRLRPLEVAASCEIIKSVLGATSFPETMGVLLHERTGGNPFFLEEICQTLKEEGSLQVNDGHVILARSIEKLQLPNTVQSVIRMRLHRLDGRARSVLRLASVIGREFTQRILEHIIADDGGLPQALQSLRHAGLIHQIRVLPEATYRFKHVLTQEVAYESLLQHQRKMLHSRVGEAIESLEPETANVHADRLAHHFGKAGIWRKAIKHGRVAANKASIMGQSVEALAMLEQVHDWVMQLSEIPSRTRLLIEVALEQERLCETMGDRGRQQSIIDDLLRLIDPIEEPIQLAEVYIRQGDLDILRGRFAEAEDSLSLALQIGREQAKEKLRHRVLRSIGFLRWHQGKEEEALRILEDLIAFSRRCESISTLVSDVTSIVTLLRARGDLERAVGYVKEALQYLDRVPARQQCYIYQQAGDVYRIKREYDLGLHYYQKALSIDLMLRRRVFSLIGIANIYFAQGKIEESLQMYRDAVAWGRKSRSAEEVAQSLRIMGRALVILNRSDEALSCLQEAAEICSTLEDTDAEVSVRRQMAALQERSGDFVSAATNWMKVRMLYALTNDETKLIEALEGQGRAARGMGESALAVRHYREALALAENLDNQPAQADLHNSIGILKWQQRDYTAALAHYEQALRICRNLHDQHHEGLMLNSLGVTLWKLQRHEEAVQRLLEAIEVHHVTAEKMLEAHALAALGDIHFEQFRFDDALTCFGASLQLRWDLDDRKGEGWMLLRLARVYSAQGEGQRSRTSAAQACEVAEEIEDEELMKESSILLNRPDPDTDLQH